MRFIGDFQRESCRKPLPLSTAAWLAQQKRDGLLSGRSRFQTPAGPTLRVLENQGDSSAFVMTSANGSIYQSSRIRMKNRRPRLTALADTTNSVVKETTHCSQRARDLVPCEIVYSNSHFHQRPIIIITNLIINCTTSRVTNKKSGESPQPALQNIHLCSISHAKTKQR